MAQERKQVQIGLRVTVEMAEWLKQQADAAQRPVSNYVAWALDQYRKQLEAASAKTT
jgi:predicted DNA-binding protein